MSEMSVWGRSRELDVGQEWQDDRASLQKIEAENLERARRHQTRAIRPKARAYQHHHTPQIGTATHRSSKRHIGSINDIFRV